MVYLEGFIMFFNKIPKDSFNELQELLGKIQLNLSELAQVPIPSVYASANDTSYTYNTLFGITANEQISSVVKTFTSLEGCVKNQVEYLEKSKDPAKLQEFKDQLKSHIARPQYYPDIPNFIKKREELHARLEPLVTALQTSFERYQVALLGQIKGKEKFKQMHIQIENKKNAGNVPSLQRRALISYLAQPRIQAEMKLIHGALITQRDEELRAENMKGLNALPKL